MPSDRTAGTPNSSPYGMARRHRMWSIWHRLLGLPSAVSPFATACRRIVVALAGKVKLPRILDDFGRLLALLQTAPPLLRPILLFIAWLIPLALLAAVAARILALGASEVRFGIQDISTQIRGVVTDFATGFVIQPLCVAGTNIRYLISPDGDNRPRLGPVGDLGQPPVIEWVVHHEFVNTAENADEAVQFLLERCPANKTHNLELAPSVYINCTALRSQADVSPMSRTLMHNSEELRCAIAAELAQELAELASLLQLLRKDPATSALDPEPPKGGFESSWQSLLHPLHVVYRTAWRRWICRRPMSTLTSRRVKMQKVLTAGLQRRQRWLDQFKVLRTVLEDKEVPGCQDCAEIEAAAEKLAPHSFSSALPSNMFTYQGKANVSTQSDETATSEPQAAQPMDQKAANSTKALIEHHYRQYGLQGLAGWCTARCALLTEHLKSLTAVMAWLESEKLWWKAEHDRLNRREYHIDLSVYEGVFQFEEELDKMARSVIARGGVGG